MDTDSLAERLQARGIRGELFLKVLAVATAIDKNGSTATDIARRVEKRHGSLFPEYYLPTEVMYALAILTQKNDVLLCDDGLYRRYE